MATKIRKPYTDNPPNTGTVNDQPSMVKAEFAKELDVNRIIEKYNRTGLLQKAHEFEGIYGDFDSMDLQEALQKIDQAQTMFETVPSKIRAHFDNDAGKFIDFATDSANLNQMREWGLAQPERPAPQSAEPAPAPAPASASAPEAKTE